MNKMKLNPIVFVMSMLLIPSIIPILAYLYSKPKSVLEIVICSIGCGILYLILLIVEMLFIYGILGDKNE